MDSVCLPSVVCKGSYAHAGWYVRLGFLPLANMPILRLLGGSQFRKFCVVCMIILTITVWITCWTQEEQPREQRRIEKGG